MHIECPECGTKIEWTQEAIYRPFCSERCQLLDLGEWADGNRYIPSDTDHDDISADDLGKDP